MYLQKVNELIKKKKLEQLKDQVKYKDISEMSNMQPKANTNQIFYENGILNVYNYDG